MISITTGGSLGFVRVDMVGNCQRRVSAQVCAFVVADVADVVTIPRVRKVSSLGLCYSKFQNSKISSSARALARLQQGTNAWLVIVDAALGFSWKKGCQRGISGVGSFQ